MTTGIVARITSGLAAGVGTLLRLLHTGRVQVYAAAMVLGVFGVGWFAFMPHAAAELDARKVRQTGEVTGAWFVGTVCLILLSACSTSIHDSADYYRHSLSQLSTPMGGGDYMWFDVKLTPEDPDNNEAAEQMRMQWLTSWLENRKMCMNGYEILERREFEFLEHNPAQYDLRYKVQCKVVVPGAEAS